MNEHEDDTIRDAMALLQAGRPGSASQRLRDALARQPRWAEGWFHLAHVLRTQGQSDGALLALERALEFGLPRPERAHLNRALIFSEQLNDDLAAEAELRRALDTRPGWLPALLNLGNLHEERGQRPQAAACYDQILAAAPAPAPAAELEDARDIQVEALARRVHLSAPDALSDDTLQALSRALDDPQRGRAARINAGHSLGQWLDTQGRFHEAFDAFTKAKQLAAQGMRPYDSAGAERATRTLMQVFDGREPQAPPRPPGDEVEPLFVCGAFRSGSTLVEQVLGAHPDVMRAGEQDWLMRRIMVPPLGPFPESLAALHPARLAELAEAYMKHLARIVPLARHARYVTDKRPDNVLLVGLIKAMFPRARIVITVRDPMDIGLSMYSQHLNPARLPYATDLGAIGHHLGQLDRLVAHWRARWPDDVLEVDYDRLVAEPAAQVDRLLRFLGLPPSERCLEFHRHIGVVRTASFRQVRQPLHTRSSGRWRSYTAELSPLAQALQRAGAAPRGGDDPQHA